MPKVGKKKYAYTPKGRAAAKKAAKSTANTRTPQTARQRSVVAKRKTASQVRSAPGGRTKAKERNALTKIGEALINLGSAYVNAPKGIATAGVELLGGKTKPKPTGGHPSQGAGSYEARRRRAGPKPATAKPRRSPLLNPPRKRKAPTYRG